MPLSLINADQQVSGYDRQELRALSNNSTLHSMPLLGPLCAASRSFTAVLSAPISGLAIAHAAGSFAPPSGRSRKGPGGFDQPPHQPQNLCTQGDRGCISVSAIAFWMRSMVFLAKTIYAQYSRFLDQC